MTEPEYLYRYQRLPDKNNLNEKDWLENLFIHNKLWFSSPKDFNDPFDCKILMRINDSEEGLNVLISRLGDEEKDFVMSSLSDPNKRDWTKNFLLQVCNDAFKDVFNKTGILCLSQPNDDILMWSHYSNSHKGLCLEFDMNILKTCFEIKDVVYRDSVPYLHEIFISKDGTESGIAIVNTIYYKSQHWKYEKEWRCIRFPLDDKDCANQYYNFPPEMLTGVIFGCEMKDEEREELRKLVKSNPKLGHVRFHEAKKKPNEFGLDIVPL